LALCTATLCALLHTAAFPFAFVNGKLFSVSEAAYLFLVPLALWLMHKKRSVLTTLAVSLGAGWASWFVLLFWLRHVTWIGTIALALLMACFLALWALGARWAMQRLAGRKVAARIGIIAALAGLWVLLEWVRTWVFSGFPWLPLAASQWDRPALLQILPYTGAAGLSWLLAYFNLALASYVTTIIRPRMDLVWWRRLNPELYSGLFLLAACVVSMLTVTNGHGEPEELFSAAIVQPYIPGALKWDMAMAQDNLQRLDRLSSFAAAQNAEVVFWPESATPWPILSIDPTTQLWAEGISTRINAPIVLGSFAEKAERDNGRTYYNGVFVVKPEGGLSSHWYAKRKLVPFGEYNPVQAIAKNFLDWPTAYFSPGSSAQPLPLSLSDGRNLNIGALLCYEDIFPALARSEVLKGADFLYVATNNAWYGEEAGAYQHALHSILRAVENRRPVLRGGNGGWSGLIDEYGAIRYLCQRPEQGVYYEGEDVFPLTRDPMWAGKLTFYTQHGDWFVILCAALCICGTLLVRKFPPPPEEEKSPDDTEDGISEDRKKARALLRKGKFRLSRRIGKL